MCKRFYEHQPPRGVGVCVNTVVNQHGRIIREKYYETGGVPSAFWGKVFYFVFLAVVPQRHLMVEEFDCFGLRIAGVWIVGQRFSFYEVEVD